MKSLWPIKPLREIVEISRERIEPSEHAGTVFNYVGLENIEGHTGNLLSYDSTPGAQIKSTKNVFHQGAILYGKLRPNLNKVHLAREGGICSTDIYVLCARNQMSASYVAHFLRSPAVREFVTSAMAGANLPRLSQENLLGIPVPVPPLPEQDRIVKLLDEADELRKLRAQADRRTTALIPALFHEMFGDPTTNPRNLRKKALGELIRVKSGDALTAKDMDVGGRFPVYGGNGISGYHSEFMFDGPVIAVGRVGVYCGVVHLTEPRSWVTDNALYVSDFSEDLDPEYLATALRTANLNQYAGRAAQPLVSCSRIYPVPILVPPLPLQTEFAARAAEIRDLQAAQAASRQRLDALFQSMLHRAFQGEL